MKRSKGRDEAVPFLIPIIALITKFAVRIFITFFGWATIIFFGKIPGKRSAYISIMAIMAFFWMILVIGIFFPEITQFVFGLFPEIIRQNRWIMRAINSLGVFVIPIAVGAISLLMDTKAKKKGVSTFKQLFLGYYYTLDLGIAMFLMLAFAPIIKIRQYLRRERSSHTPIMMRNGEYEEVLEHLHRSLEDSGIKTDIKWPESLYAMPMKIIDRVSNQLFDTLGSHHHQMLLGEGFQIYIHPTDIMIVGQEEQIQQVRAVVAKALAFEKTFMTWDEESHEIEDEINQIYTEFKKQQERKEEFLKRLCQLEKKLSKAALPYDEWEVVYRELLMIEKEIIAFKC